MKTIKRIVCPANSRKLAVRCIARREWNAQKGTKQWIRPVSARDGGDVSENERQYDDGSDPKVLDIIDIPMTEPRPTYHQNKNWLLDPEYYWEKVGSFSPLKLSALANPPKSLWIDAQSTYHGHYDKTLLTRIMGCQGPCV